MLDYHTAKKWYQGRVDKHVGRKIQNGVYMKFDAERDCFVVSIVWSRHENVDNPDAPGGKKWQRAPRSRWDMRPFAEVHRDHILITEAVTGSTLQNLFSVRHIASRTVKLSGRTWYYLDQQINGDTPIMIKNGEISSLGPPKVRVMHSDKRNEMNRKIQSVRNLLKVRSKLGAFQHVTSDEVHDYVRTRVNKTVWVIFDNPSVFLQLLDDVNPEDIQSFYPLLWLLAGGRKLASFRVDWVRNYNNLINRMREAMRHELGVVEYVEATG